MIDLALVIKSLSAFVFILALMALCAWVMRRLGMSNMGPSAKNRRLKILEFLPVDHRRRLALVSRDGVEHLLLLGPQGEVVVESNIAPASGAKGSVNEEK